MSLLKKCDVSNRLPARRNQSPHSFGSAREADQANTSKIRPDGPREIRLTFVENFILEHSRPCPGRHITASEFLGFF